MFVSTDPVAVSVDGGINTIYIRPKMDFGTKQKVTGAAMSFSLSAVGEIAEGDMSNIPLNLGAWNLALMQFNILRWAGPAFAGVACTPANIARLDPDDPLVDAVLAAINAGNQTARSAPDPKANTSSGA